MMPLDLSDASLPLSLATTTSRVSRLFSAGMATPPAAMGPIQGSSYRSPEFLVSVHEGIGMGPFKHSDTENGTDSPDLAFFAPIVPVDSLFPPKQILVVG